MNTVECLEKLANLRKNFRKKLENLPKLGVAFNPYHPETAALETEFKNLKRKLATGLVNSIWLQLGTDFEKLKWGIEFVRSLDPENKIKIYGSTFIPTPQWLARFKFRPWRGVYCSEKFL